VHAVLAAAFGREEEAHIVDALRASGHMTVSLVAVLGDEEGATVGHIAFSPVQIESGSGVWRAIALGPLAVAPAYQRRGVGSQLVQAGLRACRAAGHAVVIVLGHAQYFPRFGFVPASRYGVRYAQPVPDDVFLLLELRPGAVAGRAGVVRYGPEFGGTPS
jgi:putative acetyltransferase